LEWIDAARLFVAVRIQKAEEKSKIKQKTDALTGPTSSKPERNKTAQLLKTAQPAKNPLRVMTWAIRRVNTFVRAEPGQIPGLFLAIPQRERADWVTAQSLARRLFIASGGAFAASFSWRRFRDDRRDWSDQ